MVKVYKETSSYYNESKMSFDNNTVSKEIAYDLRQRYATQLGDLREKILIARNDRKYKDWFNLLDSLFIEISHKLDDKEKKQFNTMVTKLNTVIKTNRGAYNGKGESSEIYTNLKSMNIWLMKMMEDKDIFGSKYIDDGL